MYDRNVSKQYNIPYMDGLGWERGEHYRKHAPLVIVALEKCKQQIIFQWLSTATWLPCGRVSWSWVLFSARVCW